MCGSRVAPCRRVCAGGLGIRPRRRDIPMPSTEALLVEAEVERALFRRAYEHAHGVEPTPEELARLIQAEREARARFPAASAEFYGAIGNLPDAGKLSARVGEPSAAMPAFEVRPAQTWMTDGELREAESGCWFARTHRIPSIVDALDWFVRHRPAATAPAIKACVAEFQVVKRCEGHESTSLSPYRVHLTKFAGAFGERLPVSITPQEIGTYLMQWKAAPTRAHRWQTLATFFAWCVRMGYATENPVFLAMRKPKIRRPERLVATPAEVRFILKKAKNTDTIGFWVLSFFAGMRTSEIQAVEQLPERWSVVRLGPGIIDLPETVTKTGARTIPITPVLRQWLGWIRRRNVPFMPPNFWAKTHALRRTALGARCGDAGKGGGKPPRDPRVHNIGRRSYISYRLALPRASYAEVSNAAGNYEEVIRKHYRRKVSQSNALRYFALTPDRV